MSAAARSARRRIARSSCQLTKAPIGLMTRQYRANFRSATDDSARVACSRTSQCSPGRPVGATRTLMNSFSCPGSSKADVVREHEVEKGLLFALKRRADRNLGSRRAFLSGKVVSAVSFIGNERQKTTGVAIRCGALRWDR